MHPEDGKSLLKGSARSDWKQHLAGGVVKIGSLSQRQKTPVLPPPRKVERTSKSAFTVTKNSPKNSYETYLPGLSYKPMKTPILLALAVSALSAASAGEKERVSSSSHINLTAITAATSAKSRNSYVTTWGSSDIHSKRSRSVSISILNFGNDSAEITTETVWLGRPIGSTAYTIIGKTKEVAVVLPGKPQKYLHSSGAVLSENLTLAAIGIKRVTGEKIAGWVVLVRSGAGALLAVKSSDLLLEDFILTPR